MKVNSTDARVSGGAGPIRGPVIVGAMGQTCPTCGAAPGFSCVRITSTRIRGQAPGEGSYMRRLKQPHQTRRVPRA